MNFSRRALMQAGLAAPIAFAAAPGLAETLQEQCKRELLPTLDFPQLGKYRADNERLIASKTPVDIVFLGDSITEGWKDKRPGFFTRGRVGRGISGQTTPQMVLRMMADVVHLKPRALHIMAGTNDVAGNTGPMTPQMTQDNFRVMSDIARAHGIRLLLASIPPAAGFPWRPGLETKKPIAGINAWLKRFAKSSGAVWVDYQAVLDDGTGAMKPGLAYDGVHPTEAGYDAMATLVEPILRRLL
jgi:lysophospholipase L1-like esterase